MRARAKAWLPRECLDMTMDLKTGGFLRQYGSKITLEKVPLFKSRVIAKPYVEHRNQRNLITYKDAYKMRIL